MYLSGSKKKLILTSLVFPGAFLFVFAVLVPIIVSVYLGTTDMTSFAQTPNQVGLENFINILTKDEIFWRSLLNALLLGIVIIAVQHPICIFIAILLDKIGGNLEKICRALLFVPCVLSIVVITKMWVNILSPNYGLLDKVLAGLGLEHWIQDWLGDPVIALVSVIFIITWQGFGMGLMIYYAGVKGIPEDVYEAARIDGASEWRLHIRITLPLMLPVIAVNTTLALLGSLKQMETIMLSTNGNPGNRTQFIANYLYIKAFSSQEIGYANAISVLFVIVCLVVAVINNKITARDTTEY